MVVYREKKGEATLGWVGGVLKTTYGKVPNIKTKKINKIKGYQEEGYLNRNEIKRNSSIPSAMAKKEREARGITKK